MLLFFVLFFLFLIVISGITTIPFAIPAIVVGTVIFKRPWIFFVAFVLGLFLDLFLLRPLGQTSLIFAVFIFMLFLYERRFETQTLTFVFISTFLGSLIYMIVFGYNNVLLQSLVSALLAILLLKTLNSKFKVQN